MVKVAMPHDIMKVDVLSETQAKYRCRCKAVGTATMASHLASKEALIKRAYKNHELHATRAYVKLLQNGQLHASV